MGNWGSRYTIAAISLDTSISHNAPMIQCSISNAFLSDPSPIIGNACHSLTDSLTHCRLVNLVDVTLACEDAYSKLDKVISVADVSDEDRVDNSLLQIWKLRFGHETQLLFRH